MRIRTVKPELWSHPVMGRLDGASQALAIGLLNMADDEGYFLGDPAAIRSALRPFDDDSTSVRRGLDELSRAGWVAFKKHPEMGQIGFVVNFAAHQRIDRKTPSKLKKYYDLGLDEDSASDRRGLDERSLPEGNREGKGRERKGTAPLFASPPSRPPKAKPDKPTDSRHAPLVAELVEVYASARNGARYPFGPRDARAVSTLLAQAAPDVVARAWRRALAHQGFPTVATLSELSTHLAHFVADAAPGRGPIPAESVDWTQQQTGEVPL